MDVAAVIAAAPSPPWRSDLAAAKALMLLGLASLWVGFAAAGAAAVTVAACGYGEASPVFRVLAETTVRATVLALLLAPFAMVLVLRAAVCDAGFREELIISFVRHLQVCRLARGIKALVSFENSWFERVIVLEQCCVRVHTYTSVSSQFHFAAELMFNYGIVVLKELAHNYLEFFIASIELQISFILVSLWN